MRMAGDEFNDNDDHKTMKIVLDDDNDCLGDEYNYC